MSRLNFVVYVAAAVVGTLIPQARSAPATAPTTTASTSIRHRFLAVDDGTHTLAYVDETNPARNWTVPTGYVMDMQRIGPDRVLLNVDDGFREYDITSGKLLKSAAGTGGKSYSAWRTAEGRTLLTGDNLGGRQGACLVTYDRENKIIDCHVFADLSMLRHIRPTPEGTYLLTSVGQVTELDAQWKTLHRTRLAGNLFKAVRLANGNVLCSSGPGARFLKELSPRGEVVRELRGDSLSEGSFTGFQVLPDGHVVVANWLGHGADHDGTTLVEFDRDGKIVWRYGRPHASFVEVLLLDSGRAAATQTATAPRERVEQWNRELVRTANPITAARKSGVTAAALHDSTHNGQGTGKPGRTGIPCDSAGEGTGCTVLASHGFPTPNLRAPPRLAARRATRPDADPSLALGAGRVATVPPSQPSRCGGDTARWRSLRGRLDFTGRKRLQWMSQTSRGDVGINSFRPEELAMQKLSRCRVAALVMVAASVAAPSAMAVVNTITGTGSAQVQEYQGIGVVNADSAFKDFDSTKTALPMTVNAVLARGPSGSETSGGSANILLSDPRLSDQPDPDEFALDLASFSTLTDISYGSTAGATEMRGIVFTSTDIGATDGTALLASSQFFVDGVILIWGEKGTTNLAGNTAQINLSVEQTRGSATTPTTVLTATLNLVGQADTVSLTASGSLVAANVTVMDLTGSVPDLGPVHLVIIPSLAIPYQYEAAVGESFTLQAQISGNVRNQPGAGASISLGLPILEMAGLINSLTGNTMGDTLGQLIGSALGSAPPPAKPLVSARSGTTITIKKDAATGLLGLPQCGLLGLEAAVIPVAMTMMVGLKSAAGKPNVP